MAATVGGIAAASATLPSSGNDTANGPETLQPDGNGAALAVTAPDPAGHARLAVRVYRSVTGLTCPEAARFDGTNFGQLDESGEFRAHEGVQAAGACVDLDRAPMSVTINHYAAIGDRPAFSIVFGVVSPQIEDVVLRLGDGDHRRLPITNGAYLVATNREELVGASVVATSSDGSTRTYPIPRGSQPTATPRQAR